MDNVMHQLKIVASSEEELNQKANFHINEAVKALEVLRHVDKKHEDMYTEAQLLSQEIQTMLAGGKQVLPLGFNSIPEQGKQAQSDTLSTSQIIRFDKHCFDDAPPFKTSETLPQPILRLAAKSCPPTHLAPWASQAIPEPKRHADADSKVKVEPTDDQQEEQTTVDQSHEVNHATAKEKYAPSQQVSSAPAKAPSFNIQNPEPWLAHRASARLLVVVEGGAKFAGEYRLHSEKVHGRPSYQLIDKEPAFLFWLKNECVGGHWAFSTELGSDKGLLGRSLQISWTALPNELCSDSWTLKSEQQALWGSCMNRIPIFIIGMRK